MLFPSEKPKVKVWVRGKLLQFGNMYPHKVYLKKNPQVLSDKFQIITFHRVMRLINPGYSKSKSQSFIIKL